MISFIGTLPGAISQGLIWGIMAIGVYITYQILDIADLTVDGSFCTGGAVFVVLFGSGANVWLALFAALPSLDADTERLQSIDGLMADPMDLPTHCTFYDRCYGRSDGCKSIDPITVEVEQGHFVKCCKFCGKPNQESKEGN